MLPVGWLYATGSTILPPTTGTGGLYNPHKIDWSYHEPPLETSL